MALIDQDFDVYEGDNFVLPVTVRDVNGAVVNLTTLAAARWQVAVAKGYPPLISKALAAGITVIDAAGGRLDIALLPADTAALGGSTYRHELEITLGTNVQTVLVGKATINQSIVV